MKYYYLPLLLLIFYSTVFSQSITFSELNYNSDSTRNSGNWVELYNFGISQMDISGWYLKDDNDLNNFTIPAGTLLQPNGRLVVVDDATKFSAQFPLVSNYIGQIPFSFGNDGDQVRLFNNIGQLQVFMEYADSLPWHKAADGTGRTLEILNANGNVNDPANWFVGCMFGSPGTGFLPCNDPLVFSEINYNSDTLFDAGDWVEIWNHSTGYINLTGWSFKDSNDDNIFNFPSNINLAPDARLVLVHDTARFFSRHPNVTNWVGEFDFNLSNDGELIRLFDFNGQIKFSLVYDDDGTWPSGPDGDTYTLEFTDTLWNVNIPEAWFEGCPEGSPGFAFDEDCNVGIAAVAEEAFLISGNLSQGTIQIHLPKGTYIHEVSVYNSSGMKVLDDMLLDNNPHLVDISRFSSGIYIVAVKSEDSLVTGKFIIP